MSLSNILLTGLLLSGPSAIGPTASGVEWWLTSLDKTALLARQTSTLTLHRGADDVLPVIEVDAGRRFQSMDGFGFALTGGSAQHLIAMSPQKRAALLEELFSSRGEGIAISYLRLSIGASDLNERVYSYDDLPAGETDPRLERFDLGDDRKHVLPVLHEILAVNPKILILGSPWSAPTWMKTNQNVKAGRLRPELYSVYAQYFVKYVQAMAREGVAIDAVTTQNEPLHDGNTPSMQMSAKEQATFIKDHLGPAFRAAGIKTKIILYDHNCDAPEYPISVLTDPEARQFVDGSGFHLYAGPVTALSVVHDRFPEKNLYFTEMMAVNLEEFDVADPAARILIGATRNWSRNVILWNLAADPQFDPHTDNGGCSICQGAVTLDGDKVERNLAYYVIAHASRFVPPGSVRIESTASDSLPNVAFRTPEGKTVVIVANPGRVSKRFTLREKAGAGDGGRALVPELGGGAVATFVW